MNNNICTRCAKFPFCKNAPSNSCDEWTKQSYETKIKRMCSMCKECKDESEFNHYIERRGDKLHRYLRHYCKECQRIYNKNYMRAYRELNPEYVEKNRIMNKERYRKKKGD